MSTLQIRKLQSGAFKHVDSIDGDFFLGRFNFKQEFNKAFLVEAYGAKRRQYSITEIEVFDFGGTAEPFTNWTDLINRLVDLGYTGIDTNSIPSGGAYLSDNPTQYLDATLPLTGTEVAILNNGTNWVSITWNNIKAQLKTYFDTLYAPIGGGGASKKTQIIEFAWGGGGYASTTNWWKLNSFISKYGTNFVNGGSITPTTSFSSDTNNFCFRESLMFNGKIKAITVEGDNNGVPWNCDFAIRNHELLNPYNAGQDTAAINNQIVARKQFVVGSGGNQTRTFFTPITDFGDILLPKNSVIKPYFKTEGVANSNWQNVVLKILIEEV